MTLSAEDILAVIDHLGIEKAHFVSLSIGSVILQKLDIERPELIDRMVMAGAIFDGSRLMHLVCAQRQTAQLHLAVSGHLLAVQFHRAAAQQPPDEPLDFPPSEPAA